jgi:putative transferase (TIGR04331 family)
MKIKSHYFNVNEYFFLNTYLPPSIEEKILKRLGQNPKSWKLATVSQVEVDNRMREWMVNEHDSFDKFSTIINRMIPKHIPTAYLEGYQSLLACTEYLGWPQKPKCIFTSNAYWSYDVFKAWAAGKTEHGVPLVIGQHGGHVGATLWASHYDHQINIADKWLSWGWSDEKTPNIIPVGNLWVIDSTLNYDPNGYALMVENVSPRYSYHMLALPVAGQWLSYFDDQCLFISALPMHIRKQVLLRLYSNDFGWCQKERWRDSFPYIELDEGHEPIDNLLNKCRISISTYNSTTILETLVFNIPTIMFFNPKHWELRDDAIVYFDLLKSVSILHETPESAANHMVAVWDNVASWWKSNAVQNARRKFCKRYVNIEDESLNRLEIVIKDIISQKGAYWKK